MFSNLLISMKQTVLMNRRNTTIYNNNGGQRPNLIPTLSCKCLVFLYHPHFTSLHKLLLITARVAATMAEPLSVWLSLIRMLLLSTQPFIGFSNGSQNSTKGGCIISSLSTEFVVRTTHSSTFSGHNYCHVFAHFFCQSQVTFSA